jgi:hypothetical protein
MSVITTRYPGSCDACGAEIPVGSRARWEKGRLLCAGRSCGDPAYDAGVAFEREMQTLPAELREELRLAEERRAYDLGLE